MGQGRSNGIRAEAGGRLPRGPHGLQELGGHHAEPRRRRLSAEAPVPPLLQPVLERRQLLLRVGSWVFRRMGRLVECAGAGVGKTVCQDALADQVELALRWRAVSLLGNRGAQVGPPVATRHMTSRTGQFPEFYEAKDLTAQELTTCWIGLRTYSIPRT